eukprot:6747834-Pyramimonas_sp.AAC.1
MLIFSGCVAGGPPVRANCVTNIWYSRSAVAKRSEISWTAACCVRYELACMSSLDDSASTVVSNCVAR